MTRILGLALAASTAFAVAAYAAPQPQRVRGTIESFNAHGMTIKSRKGTDVKILLNKKTKYATLVKSSLSHVTKGSYIGTAAKGSGNFLVALELVIFPPSMRGVGEGHYAWDKLPDTTLSGKNSVSSTMTNGNVKTVETTAASGNAKAITTTMTNGSVQSSSERTGAKQITVTYKGGEKKILVPPTAPIVALHPAGPSILKQGAHVFVKAADEGGKITAQFVAVGKGGLVPPM